MGKPYAPIYDLAWDMLQKQKPSIEKKKTVAVGDNPASDIKGANDFGIVSALVLTGVAKENSKDIPADHVFSDFPECVSKLF